jgi:hypothetical protein
MKYKMNYTLKKLATTAITLTGVVTAAGITLSAQSAQALTINFGPGDFQIDTGGRGSNNALATSTINTTGIIGSATSNTGGFNNAFSNTFILLGANPTNVLGTSTAPANRDDFRGTNTTATSDTDIVLDAFQVTQPIALSFDFAFYGNASATVNNNIDQFSISLFRQSDGAEFTFLSRSSNLGYGALNNQTVNINGGIFDEGVLEAGTYQLRLSLTEGTNTLGNSAAGFNNISLNVAEPVPFGFSTNASLLVFGGVFYGFNKFRKNMAVKKYQN